MVGVGFERTSNSARTLDLLLRQFGPIQLEEPGVFRRASATNRRHRGNPSCNLWRSKREDSAHHCAGGQPELSVWAHQHVPFCGIARHRLKDVAGRIDHVDRIVPGVGVQVRLAAAKQNRVSRRPPPLVGVIVSRAKSNELGHSVVDATCEAERMNRRRRRAHGIGFVRDKPPIVVVDLIDRHAVIGAHDEAHAAERVADQAIDQVVAHGDDVVGDVRLGPINEQSHHVACAVDFGNGVKPIRVHEILSQRLSILIHGT